MTKNVSDIIKLKTLDPKFKGTVASSLEQVIYINKLNNENYTLTICKEFMLTFQYGIYFHKNSFLKLEVNRKISEFKANGLINNWASYYMDMKFLNVKSPDKGPKKLNLPELRGGFEVWFIGLSLGIFIFAIEYISRTKLFYRCFIKN